MTWNDSMAELERAVRWVMEGGSYVSTSAAPYVLHLATGSSQLRSGPREQLTPREIQVVRAIVDGRTIRSTARELGVAMKTVEAHRARAFLKLGARNQADALRTVLSDPSWDSETGG